MSTASCSATNALEYWCSRDAMDIEGAGEALCVALVNTGLANDVADLYTLTEAQLADLSKQFADISTDGQFRVSGPLPAESDEPALNDLYRLVFRFNRRDHGRLRVLIDHINDLAT